MTLESIAGAAGHCDRNNHLLYECLQLAYVSDRAGIEARLWSAPGERR